MNTGPKALSTLGVYYAASKGPAICEDRRASKVDLTFERGSEPIRVTLQLRKVV